MTTLAERQHQKREAIMEAALQLFTEHGFHGTAVPAVAEQAGVGAGTIYRYFESKEALVNALYRRYKMAAMEHMLVDFPFGATFREQFHVVWRRWADYVVAHPQAFEFIELHHHASYLDEESLAVERRSTEMVEVLVRQAQDQRLIKNLPPFLLLGLIMGAFIGMVRATRERGEPLADAIVDAGEQCAWEAIRI